MDVSTVLRPPLRDSGLWIRVAIDHTCHREKLLNSCGLNRIRIKGVYRFINDTVNWARPSGAQPGSRSLIQLQGLSQHLPQISASFLLLFRQFPQSLSDFTVSVSSDRRLAWSSSLARWVWGKLIPGGFGCPSTHASHAHVLHRVGVSRWR